LIHIFSSEVFTLERLGTPLARHCNSGWNGKPIAKVRILGTLLLRAFIADER
jgi:hypothetical protein